MLFARHASKGHVHAFEPTDTARLLRTNLAAAGAANVTVHEVALGNATGRREEAIYRIWGSAPEMKEYPFTTLDTFVAETGLDRLDLVKIDVDGFDLEVLKGARETLRRFDPWVLIELNHALATRGQSVSEALLWLSGQGYTEALVLDQENFLFRRARTARGAGEGLRLRFDREPVLLPPAFGPGAPIEGLFSARPQTHNQGRFEGDVTVVPGPRWSYAASWPVAAPPPQGQLIVEAEIEVLEGHVGLGCLAANSSDFIGKEVALRAAPGVQVARLLAPQGAAVSRVVLRNVAEDGAESRASLRALRAAPAVPAPAILAPVMRHDLRSFALDQVFTSDAAARPGREIAILPLQELGEELGFAEPYIPEIGVYRYGVEDFKTEIAEPGIYRYLYRNLRPRRHLEFGTWEGFGTALCASSCEAEIWTVNLPEGERDAAGAPVYAAQRLPGEAATPAAGVAGDAGDRIGWRYRAAGYGPRVHQLLMDSRDFPVGDFAPGFFDTVLVDGGHTPEVMAADTEVALRLARPGGVIIWHDFCPDPKALAASEAGRGVMQGWVENYDRWRGQLSGLYWLRPSWLLIGLRA